MTEASSLQCVQLTGLNFEFEFQSAHRRLRAGPMYGAEQRRQEFLREDQLRKLHEEEVIKANLLSDDRVETKRRLARMAEEQKEYELAYKLDAVGSLLISQESSLHVHFALILFDTQAAAAKKTREIEQEQEERLARELQRMNLESLRDEKLRQQLRQTSHELRGVFNSSTVLPLRRVPPIVGNRLDACQH